jgi:hypothetical protein
MKEKRPKQKCCFSGCDREGTPEPGYDFYACQPCLEEMQKEMNQAYRKSMERQLGKGIWN